MAFKRVPDGMRIVLAKDMANLPILKSLPLLASALLAAPLATLGASPANAQSALALPGAAALPPPTPYRIDTSQAGPEVRVPMPTINEDDPSAIAKSSENHDQSGRAQSEMQIGFSNISGKSDPAVSLLSADSVKSICVGASCDERDPRFKAMQESAAAYLLEAQKLEKAEEQKAFIEAMTTWHPRNQKAVKRAEEKAQKMAAEQKRRVLMTAKVVLQQANCHVYAAGEASYYGPRTPTCPHCGEGAKTASGEPLHLRKPTTAISVGGDAAYREYKREAFDEHIPVAFLRVESNRLACVPGVRAIDTGGFNNAKYSDRVADNTPKLANLLGYGPGYKENTADVVIADSKCCAQLQSAMIDKSKVEEAVEVAMASSPSTTKKSPGGHYGARRIEPASNGAPAHRHAHRRRAVS